MSIRKRKLQRGILIIEICGICIAALFMPHLSANAAENTENIRALYEEYNARFAAVEDREDITEYGFETVEIGRAHV